jgi:hypothetical protein
MAKVFISYKYGDDQVWQGLDQKFWAEETDKDTGVITKETKATGRAYVNLLEAVMGKENILKGEKQDESLKGKTEDQIWETLKPRVHDSSVTLVLISRGMKDFFEPEAEQWMPNEIRYSLWQVPRGEKTSATNALLGVIVPDRNGSYGYIYEKSSCSDCGHIKVLNHKTNPHLFNILRGNIFNRKNDNGNTCQGAYCSSTIYDGDHSYLHLLTMEEFLKDRKYQDHIDKALQIKENKDSYWVEKTM